MKQQRVAYPKLGKLLLPVLCDYQPNPCDPISCQATTSPHGIVTRHCGRVPSLSAPLNYCTGQTGRFSSTQHQPTVQHHLSATTFLFDFSFFFFLFFLFFPPSSTFLIEGVLGSKDLFSESRSKWPIT